MATKPLTTEAIELTEKKMDMTLDDIIKMSKPNTGKAKKQRVLNKGQRVGNGNQDRSFKVRQYMDSRSNLRQGVLAQRRNNFQGNSFPLAAEAARKAGVAPFRNIPLNRNKAINWNRQRPGGPLRRQGNSSNGGNILKKQQQQNRNGNQNQRRQPQQQPQQQQQQQQQQQHSLPRREMTDSQRPKTLDSLFANMKEQRMRAFSQKSNEGPVRGGSFTHNSNGGPLRGGSFTHNSNGVPLRGGSYTQISNGGLVRGRGAFNQPRQPWLRGRFGTYRN